ncbi:MAG: hypothetical protein GVX96_07085 [Bacteroidetes bacterium]|jgi:predicted peroxiredoxin|nr:hypothetical protein [Bacteroidota bacterium]
MKNLNFLMGVALLACFFSACEEVSSAQKKPKPAHELIINLTSDATISAHGALMGIHLAEKAIDNGLNVTVFLNVNGVKLLQPGADSLVFHGENIITALHKVTEKGGEIMACPHCMEALGIDQAKIPSNVTLSEEKVMMDKLQNNPTVFTY